MPPPGATSARNEERQVVADGRGGRQDYKGYWMDSGWSDVAIVRTQSRIDVPRNKVAVEVPTWIAGVACDGDRAISLVEVSMDGGDTWRPATLRRPLSRNCHGHSGLGTGPRRTPELIASCAEPLMGLERCRTLENARPIHRARPATTTSRCWRSRAVPQRRLRVVSSTAALARTSRPKLH